MEDGKQEPAERSSRSRDDRPRETRGRGRRGEQGRRGERTRRDTGRRDGDGFAIDDDPDAPPPRIISRGDHRVSRRDVDPDALNILYRLHNKGHRGYLVGGGVRDLMLGLAPKDFDIATDARPGRLKRLFSNCRIIGRRFRLAHIHFGEKIIEVATFRSSGKSDDVVREGDLIHRDNVFGSPGEDAMRRDLTINGLFYDISTFSIIDYVDGFEDLLNGVVRTIVDPEVSFREDPVRMLRVIRHATRLDFEIEEGTRRALSTQQDEILKANAARLLEEFYKDLSSGRSRAFFEELHRTGFLGLLVEPLVATFKQRGERTGKSLLFESLDRLDQLKADGVEITHPIGLAALLAPLILPVTRRLDGSGDEAEPEPFQKALHPVFTRLKIYRRDEERLWHILGAWGRIDRAFERGTIPKSLSKRHYFPEAAEVYALLSPESPELEDFLAEVRSLPPPSEEPPPTKGRGRKRGGRGGRGRGPGKGGPNRGGPGRGGPGRSSSGGTGKKKTSRSDSAPAERSAERPAASGNSSPRRRRKKRRTGPRSDS